MVLGDNALTDITLKELYEEHLAHCEVRRLSEHTINTYKKNYQCLGSDYIVSETNDSTNILTFCVTHPVGKILRLTQD